MGSDLCIASDSKEDSSQAHSSFNFSPQAKSFAPTAPASFEVLDTVVGGIGGDTSTPFPADRIDGATNVITWASNVVAANSIGDFRLLPQSAWETIYSKFDVDTFSENSMAADDENLVCNGCGEAIDPCIDDTMYDGALTGDACDKCSSFHHSSCLISAGSWHICAGCASGRWSHLLVTQASDVLNQERTEPHEPPPDHVCPGKSTEDVPIGWPTLEADQQVAFQSWYVDGMAAKKEVLLQAVRHLQEQTSLQESCGDLLAAKAKVQHTGELIHRLEKLGTMEHMRENSWRFFRSESFRA